MICWQSIAIDRSSKPCKPAALPEDLGVMGLAGHLVSSAVVVREIERRRQLHQDTAKQIEKLDEYFAQHLDTLELKDLYMHLIIRRGIRYQQEWVAWCDEALAAIDRAVKPAGDSPLPRSRLAD